jgi:16S rRNA (cytosine967-C5)-methyltransferase
LSWSNEPAPRGAAVRAAAARRVAAVVAGGRSLGALPASKHFGSRDSSLVQALTVGALRWHHRLKWQLERLLSRPLAPRDAELGALLRVGLFQLQWLRVPTHAAVASTVAAADLIGRGRAKGLVNAVLRRFVREREALENAVHESLEALYSHPAWLIEAVRADWPERAAEIFAANNEQPPMWLRVNARHPLAAEYRNSLQRAGTAYSENALLPQGLLLADPISIADLPGYNDGRVSVQDGAAQLAAALLDLAPGQRVLDACAAPGNKTAHILESCAQLDAVIAIDKDSERLDMARRNLERLGLDARLLHADAERPDEWWDGQPFDRILLDAPCTATGVIRRHPDIKVLRRQGDIAQACNTQSRLFQSLWPLLKPGGRFVYATCSVLSAENSGQVEAFLRATPDAVLAARQDRRSGQHFPGEANMDGFYYACIDRRVRR